MAAPNIVWPNNFSCFAEDLTKINQPLVPQLPMSGTQGTENSGGLIPTAMLSSMFGRMIPDALEKLKQEAPKPASRGNGPYMSPSAPNPKFASCCSVALR
jgi:hypothetical protein